MKELLITVVVTFVLSALLYGLIAIPSRLKITEDAIVLRYGKGFKIFSALGFVFFGLISIMTIRSYDNQILMGLMLACFFMVIGVPLLLEAFWVRIDILQNGIQTFTPWRSNRHIDWKEIQSIDYSDILQWHIIRTDSGNVYLHDYLSDKWYLLNMLNKEMGIPLPDNELD